MINDNNKNLNTDQKKQIDTTEIDKIVSEASGIAKDGHLKTEYESENNNDIDTQVKINPTTTHNRIILTLRTPLPQMKPVVPILFWILTFLILVVGMLKDHGRDALYYGGLSYMVSIISTIVLAFFIAQSINIRMKKSSTNSLNVIARLFIIGTVISVIICCNFIVPLSFLFISSFLL